MESDDPNIAVALTVASVNFLVGSLADGTVAADEDTRAQLDLAADSVQRLVSGVLTLNDNQFEETAFSLFQLGSVAGNVRIFFLMILFYAVTSFLLLCGCPDSLMVTLSF